MPTPTAPDTVLAVAAGECPVCYGVHSLLWSDTVGPIACPACGDLSAPPGT